MNLVNSIVIWLFTHSIFGTILLAYGAYGLAKLVKLPVPEAAGAFAFLIGISTLPSYPRYKFEKDTYAELAKHPEYRIVQATHWGSLTEPLTWFHSFTGHFRAVAPDPIGSDKELGISTFRQIVFSYDEKPQEWMYYVSCNSNEISPLISDNNGKFNLIHDDWKPISAKDRTIFCETNWKKENDIFWLHIVKNDKNLDRCIYPFGGKNGLLIETRIAC